MVVFDSSAERGAYVRRQLSGSRFANVEWIDDIGSTNAVLIAAADEGAGERVLIADHQSAGRGRRARVWTTPPGDALLCSTLIRDGITPQSAHEVTAMISLAAIDACATVAGVDASLKWPNDLLVGDRKLAGVLAEGVVQGDRMVAIVVGIGLNIALPTPRPDGLEGAAALTDVSTRAFDRAELAVALLDRLPHWLTTPSAERLARVRAVSATIGRPVVVETDSATLEGMAIDIAEDGDRKSVLTTSLRRCANKFTRAATS